MNKKGFTLVELLAVIVILGIIIVVVAPSLLDTSKGARKKTYETKIANIETAAVLFGQDNYRKIINGANDGTDGYALESTEDVIFRTMTISVKDLVPNYLSKDTGEDSEYFVQDPRDNSDFLDDYTITIRINPNTRKVTAKFNG